MEGWAPRGPWIRVPTANLLILLPEQTKLKPPPEETEIMKRMEVLNIYASLAYPNGQSEFPGNLKSCGNHATCVVILLAQFVQFERFLLGFISLD